MPVTQPDSHGYFGAFGGRFVPETLMSALFDLEAAWGRVSADEVFQRRLAGLLRDYVGRPTPLFLARHLTEHFGGGRIWLKREDLNHTGAHKINNALGQALLAKTIGKHRLIAETGAGQHGVASATAAALLGLECVVYMGVEDMRRQAPNVRRMQLLGAQVVPVDQGSCTLKDAVNEAIRDWVTNVETTHYVIGSVIGPHPYPLIVRELQKTIGIEARAQILEQTGSLPGAVIACVGGGSNSIGIFHGFLADPVRLYGIEAGGRGEAGGDNAAPLVTGTPGVLHGARTYLLQDSDGQIAATHSVSAGLDYPGVGPEHAALKASGRVLYDTVGDDDALAAFHLLCKTEGIIPALESAHAVAYAERVAAVEEDMIVNLSGRGDKDLESLVP